MAKREPTLWDWWNYSPPELDRGVVVVRRARLGQRFYAEPGRRAGRGFKIKTFDDFDDAIHYATTGEVR